MRITKMTRYRKGFSLIELLITMAIVALIGAVAVMALDLMFASFWQTDDQIAARSEIEFALNELRPQFTNIGLGMPNNRSGTNSFKEAFGTGLVPDDMDAPVFISGDSELLYAWAVPTGVKIKPSGSGKFKSGEGQIELKPALASSTFAQLKNFSYNGRDIGISNDMSVRSWILFPSLRIPLHIDTIATDSLSLAVTPTPDASSLVFKDELRGYEEVHLLQIARLYVENGRLMQEIYGGGEPKVLATNISAVRFEFGDPDDPDNRLLTMTIVARGNSAGGKGAGIGNLPADIASLIPDGDKQYRFIVESMTWRIKN